jgi:hypothetical protein
MKTLDGPHTSRTERRASAAQVSSTINVVSVGRRDEEHVHGNRVAPEQREDREHPVVYSVLPIVCWHGVVVALPAVATLRATSVFTATPLRVFG